MSTYTFSLEYLERKHGLCGKIDSIGIRLSDSEDKPVLVITTDTDIKPAGSVTNSDQNRTRFYRMGLKRVD